MWHKKNENKNGGRESRKKVGREEEINSENIRANKWTK
jgi:hypothetical protein